MQIDAIELFHLGIPLRRSLPTSLGPRDRLDTVLVALHGDGATGWGEASPGDAPLRGGEWTAGVFGVLRDWLAPAIVGQNITSGEDLSQALAKFRGNAYAKGALDAAWWDLNARRQNRPLHALLGGTRNAVEVGPVFEPMESIDEFVAAIGAAFEAGFARAKLKFRPGWDIHMVEFVRQQFPTQTLHIDVEGSLTIGHIDMLYRLEDFMLAMIEQPFAAEDLVGHAMAQESLRTPICLDESITSPFQADMAMELRSCKYVNVKPSRVGGLTPALAIHDICHENCTPCWVGAMPQTTVGSRAGFALAAKANCTYPADYFAGDQFLVEDIAEPILPAKADDGVQRIPLWSTSGIGVTPDAALLEKFCIARADIRPGT
jgi:O-succinylbenzoate synthase